MICPKCGSGCLQIVQELDGRDLVCRPCGWRLTKANRPRDCIDKKVREGRHDKQMVRPKKRVA